MLPVAQAGGAELRIGCKSWEGGVWNPFWMAQVASEHYQEQKFRPPPSKKIVFFLLGMQR